MGRFLGCQRQYAPAPAFVAGLAPGHQRSPFYVTTRIPTVFQALVVPAAKFSHERLRVGNRSGAASISTGLISAF
jgi:hypothetical protein